MQTRFAKILLLLLAFTVAVPESFAKRAGSGRSAGRQSSSVVGAGAAPPQAPAPPGHPAPPANPPDAAKQTPPPHAPERTLPQHARSPWGGVLGGALLGLGLGSLLGDRDDDQEMTNRSVGDSGTGSSASGTGDDEAIREPVLGSLVGLGIFALVAAYLVRRARRRTRR